MSLRRPIAIAVVVLHAAVIVGCNIETTPTDEASNSQANNDGFDADAHAPSLHEGFHAERYGVGAKWYGYDSKTHAVSPHSVVYRATGDEFDAALAVDSYYDDEGDSGYFTLRIRALDTSESTNSTLELTSNVKEKPVCVDLAEPSEVDCEQTHDLVLRTDLRVVPSAGFAVQNPSIYTSSHFSASEPVDVFYAEGDSLDPPPDDWQRLPDAKSRRDDALLADDVAELEPGGEGSSVFAQASADMMLAAWTVTRTETDGELQFLARCEPLESSPDAQTSPDMADAREATVSVDDSSLALVDLCGDDGPEVVERTSTPPAGLWNSADTFDVIVERFDGEVSVRLAPGELIWSTGERELDAAPSIPESLWE
ncbi:MAG: hypothetical protein ACOCV2_06685 [Persicimonas sp.]